MQEDDHNDMHDISSTAAGIDEKEEDTEENTEKEQYYMNVSSSNINIREQPTVGSRVVGKIPSEGV